MTNSIGEIENTDLMFVIGTNTTENHPVIGTFMKKAIKKGAKLIVADPRKIELANYADVYLQIRPGSNVALLNGMLHVIITEELYDKEYIESRTVQFEEMKKKILEFSVEEAAKICKVPIEDIKKAARLYAEADKAGIYYAMGITQQSDGTNHVKSVANLAMSCGNVGIESGGINPLRGQNNVQGACDLGALPNVYPGYQKVANKACKEKFEKAWNVTDLSSKNGLTIPKIMNAGITGEIKFLYIMGENPLVSDPDLNHIEKAFSKFDFIVVQDIFLTETAERADVVLPAACFAEKDGTFTNTERRVQMVRKAVDAPGEAKADWEIIDEIMRRMGYENNFNSASNVMEEIAMVTPQYGGITYDRIEKTGLQWPCPTKDHPGTKFLHEGEFAIGKGIFTPVEYKKPAEETDAEYNLVLTTGRVLYHYHTRSMTKRVEGLEAMVDSSYVEIAPSMAKELNVKDGEMVAISSRRGKIEVKIKITDIISDNVVFMPFHFAEAAANRLTNAALDPVTDIPEYKVCAVKIEKL